LEGLARPLHYQLTSHTFQSFQQLLDKAIVLESMRRELGELKMKASTPGPSGSHTRPCFTSPLEPRSIQEARQEVMASSSSISTSHSSISSSSALLSSFRALGRRLHALHTRSTVR
jgi:hypothetical protein